MPEKTLEEKVHGSVRTTDQSLALLAVEITELREYQNKLYSRVDALEKTAQFFKEE